MSSAPQILADLMKPNMEAAAFVRGKTAVSRAVFDRMLPELRARSFVITGVESANAVQTVRDRIAQLPEGADWNEVKKDIAATMSPWLDDDAAARRADLLLRFHGFQAYQATQWTLDHDTIDTHPYYLYRTAQDDRVRDSHAALDGIILPIDDPFWKTHFPPWDWGCRCEVIAISEADAQLARDRDAGLPPDQHAVIQGARLDQLHQGWLINGPSARIDVRSEYERGVQGAFRWNPGDLRISPKDLEQRYDAEVWASFRQWAESTALHESGKISVWEWMNGSSLASAKAPIKLSPVPVETVETTLSKLSLDKKTLWTQDEIQSLWREMKESAPLKADAVVESIAGAKATGPFSEGRIKSFVNQALSVMPPELVSGLGKLKFVVVNTIPDGSIADYDDSTNVIRLAWQTITAHGLGPQVVRERVFHEMGHWVHIKGPQWYRDAITKLYDNRTKGENLVLSQLYGVPVKLDKWYDEYAGREYGRTYRGIEVVTRHFQLFGNPKRMAFLIKNSVHGDTITENMRTVLSVFFKGSHP